jgi:TRAP-type uncharacterized transport system substrate-binding protein
VNQSARADPLPDPHEVDVPAVVDVLRQSRVTLLVADPHDGATELLKAQVLPALGRRGSDRRLVPVSSRRVPATPERRDPQETLEIAIYCDTWNESTIPTLRTRVASALIMRGARIEPPLPSLADGVLEWGLALRARFLFVFDRFEHCVAAASERAGIQAFLDEFVRMANEPLLPAHFLVAVPAYAEPMLEPLAERIPALGERCVRLPRQARPAPLARASSPPPPRPAPDDHATVVTARVGGTATPGPLDADVAELARTMRAAQLFMARPPGAPVESGEPLRLPHDAEPHVATGTPPDVASGVALDVHDDVDATEPADVTPELVADESDAEQDDDVSADGEVTAGEIFEDDEVIDAVDRECVTDDPGRTAAVHPLADEPRIATHAAPRAHRTLSSRGAVPVGLAVALTLGTWAWLDGALPFGSPTSRAPTATARVDFMQDAAHARPVSVTPAATVAAAPVTVAPATAAARPAAVAPAAVATMAPAAGAAAPMPAVAPDARHVRVAAEPGTTNADVVADLARVLAPGIALDVEAAPEAVLATPAAQATLAIVTFEAIRPARGSHEPAGSARDPFRVVAPLYTEEIHVVARRDSPLTSIDQLRGARINFGPRDSGRRLTATRLYERMFGGRVPADTGALDDADALRRLVVDRSLDAVIVIEAQPAHRLASLAPDVAAQVKLLTLDRTQPASEAAIEDYLPTRLRAASYPALLQRDAPTLATMAFLVASRPADARAVDDLTHVAQSLCRGLTTLRREGHAKWREVQPLLVLDGGWQLWPPGEAVFRACPSEAARGAVVAKADQPQRGAGP